MKRKRERKEGAGEREIEVGEMKVERKREKMTFDIFKSIN